LSSPTTDLSYELTRVLLSIVFLSVVFMASYYSVPVDVVSLSIGHVTLLFCDFRSIPSEFVSGTTILRVQPHDENVSLVIERSSFSANLTGGILKCKNAELLAVSQKKFDGLAVVSGNIISVPTTDGESTMVLFVDSIRAPQPYEEWITSNRNMVGLIVLMATWAGSALLFISVARVVATPSVYRRLF